MMLGGARHFELALGDMLDIERYARTLGGDLGRIEDAWVEYGDECYRVYARSDIDLILVLQGCAATGEWVRSQVVFKGTLNDMSRSTLAAYLFTLMHTELHSANETMIETYYTGD
jgi:hypothetical protein